MRENRFGLRLLLLVCMPVFSWFFSFSQCTTCLVHITPGAVDSLCNTQNLNWAKWSSITAGTATGTISSSVSMTVNMSTGGLFTTGGMFSGGTFPVQYNVPVNSTSIANANAGIFTFCFNKPVTNPQIALSSIGNGGQSVQINTSVPYCVIWQGVNVTYLSDTSFRGTEGYTIIRFPGTHTCISFNYLQAEYYCNLAFGIQDTSCQYPAPRICIGDSVHLNAAGGNSYSWLPVAGLNRDTGAMVTATPSVTTTYYVTDGNCMDSILVKVNPFAAISPGDTSVCEGSFVQLQAGGGTSYKWMPTQGLSDPNIANPVVYPFVTTTYTVTISPSPCDDSTRTVKITSYPSPPVPSLVQFHDTLICSFDPGYSSFQWYYDNAPIAGATDTFYVASKSGNYNVGVTDTNGCQISVGINILLGLSKMYGNEVFYLTPNPAGDDLTFHISSLPDGKKVTISVLNMLGEVLKTESMSLEKELALSVKNLSCGIYFVRISIENETWLGRFVKN